MTENNNTTRAPKIGEVYLVQFDGVGNEQKGWRPGLVFQNNIGNAHSPNVIVLPLTSSLKKADMPTHVVVPAEGTGLVRDSMVLCENPECVSKSRLGKYLTTLPEKYISKVAAAHLLATSAISFVDLSTLTSLWKRASELNAVIA